MDPAKLPLRDVHLPEPPSWWPPAPGWWLLGAAILLVLLGLAGWIAWRRLRRRRWLRWFEQASEGHGTLPERLAAISALLRRAARRRQPGAELLQGEAWLRFLDGADGTGFSAGPGRLLLEGSFRRDVDADAFVAARALARKRFLELMEGRR